MKHRTVRATALCLALAASVPQAAVAGDGHKNDDAKAAVAAIIALGIGVAIARHGDDHDLNSDWDHGTYGEPFSPSKNVVCLPQPRQCFERSHYSARWTRRIFGS